jgi:chromosomal replication initiation ATPase DnaA
MEAQLENIDLEQRCVAVRALSELSKVPLSEKVVRYLAESPHGTDSREIKGLLVRFQSYAALLDLELTEEITDELFWGDPRFCDRLANA